MDDLSGLSWTTNQTQKPVTTANTSASYYPPLRPTPPPSTSGRNTPLSGQNSGVGVFGSKNQSLQPSQKPAQDHFSNLVNFGNATKSSSINLSLKERQEQLDAEKRRKDEEKQNQFNAQFGNGQFWDSLSQKPSTSNSRTASPAIPSLGPKIKKASDDDDLFAAFNANTKVDNTSFYPPPSGADLVSGKGTPTLDLSSPSAWNQPSISSGGEFNDTDDPFGLGAMKPMNQVTSATSTPAPTNDTDIDFLGDLGKPVEEIRQKQAAQKNINQSEPGKPIEDSDDGSDEDENTNVHDLDPFEKAVSQLVELGFTPENARRGLTESGVGLNIQAAAGWLLDDAERKARQKAQVKSTQEARSDRHEKSQSQEPAWGRNSGKREADLSKTAAAMGASFLKSANSFWKTGQKRMQQAVADFQQEGDPTQPKWMREAQQNTVGSLQKGRAEVTDEALMLESGGRPSREHSRSQAGRQQPSEYQTGNSREQSPFNPDSNSRESLRPKWKQSPLSQAEILDPKARLSKLTQDEGTTAYISPARRKKVSPQPQPIQQPNPPAKPEINSTTTLPSRPISTSQRSTQSSPGPRLSSQTASRTITPRLIVPQRQIPSMTPSALQTSHRHRADGTTYFKRGDYAAAHSSYSNSLSSVPQTHPLAILILTNRALTALKIGEPKQAINDADNALRVIGPGGGIGEVITVDNGDTKDMRELYGKALSRKAEALEQLEKWADAGSVWQLCVEGGVGGPTAIAGKQRCQKALAPKPKPTPQVSRSAAPTLATKPKSKPRSGLTDLAPAQESAAVARLRAANKAAEAADDEKFALSEKVDAKISAWRDGKKDNLRALLGSLDTVLWESSGWKKVGMHELVMANRVKIVYMKAIAKCHPDKLPQDASTEVKLIAGTVFATLNESWDKFKAENGL